LRWRNHRGLLDAIFGTGKLGSRTLLLNTDFSAPQLREVCEREGAKLLIYDEDLATVVAQFDPPAGRVLAWREESGEQTSGGVMTSDEPATLDDLIGKGDPSTPPKPEAKPKVVLLTSGTTGTPKGASREVMKISVSCENRPTTVTRVPSGTTAVRTTAPGCRAGRADRPRCWWPSGVRRRRGRSGSAR
jgi:fatty-acyl-CoA synthase